MPKAAKSLLLKDIKIGRKAAFKVRITSEMIDAFAGLVGDYNPLHVDSKYAGQTLFKKRVAHGMLVSSFFSTLIGMYLPGKNSLILSQNIKYIRPVYINDNIEIAGAIKRINRSARIVSVEITARKIKNNETAIISENLVLIR